MVPDKAEYRIFRQEDYYLIEKRVRKFDVSNEFWIRIGNASSQEEAENKLLNYIGTHKETYYNAHGDPIETHSLNEGFATLLNEAN